MSNEVVDVETAAKRLGIGRQAGYAAVRRGQIPALRFGRRLVVPVAALERMLETGQSARELGKGAKQ